MAKDKVPQNAVGGGAKDKGRVKPESLGGGISFEELLMQEKGNRDRAALRFNAANGNPGSTAYSPRPDPVQTAAVPTPTPRPAAPVAAAPAMPAAPPIPTPRPDAGPIFEPGGGMDISGMASLGIPFQPPMMGVPPDLNMPPIAPQQLAGVPPGLMTPPIPERFGRPSPKGPRLGTPPFMGS